MFLIENLIVIMFCNKLVEERFILPFNRADDISMLSLYDEIDQRLSSNLAKLLLLFCSAEDLLKKSSSSNGSS